ncbi:ParA family protein [Caballeronia concitans]|jgi:chromosome partitioning protein|uniref:Cobyrinic acid a,c-diamide synthase n=1 Tax=Caballeronia concitans TaxID=1777133 RepID=A0A658R6C7_9BURK|nr:ParA family protein [Caballeronia concitans]SAL52673.1 cobyrinic acid a,c-diamide synthase [Caballeronia concitans]
MKTIVVASQKGGSGKTTLVSHLAVEAEHAGDGPAWIIDTDRQGTLSRWHENRAVDSPQRADVPFTKLRAALDALDKQGAAYCFVDTAPALSDQNTALLHLADLVLIPVRPSPADLWAVSETVEQVKDAGKPLLFVITQAKAQASITAQTVAVLSGHGRVAQAFIADRVPYAMAMTEGRTAPELGAKTPAAAEIAGLWSCVKSSFHENKKARKVANG